jgi:rhodanese-related sulfurtransferase
VQIDPEEIEAVVTPEPSETVVVPPETDPTELPMNIGTAQSFLLYETGQVDFVDARAAEIYEAGHIAGAYSVPYTEAANRVARLYADGFLDPSRRVVVYCIGGTCDESNYVVRALMQAGFEMIHIDDDGYPAWLAAGHPTAEGADMTQETP